MFFNSSFGLFPITTEKITFNKCYFKRHENEKYIFVPSSKGYLYHGSLKRGVFVVTSRNLQSLMQQVLYMPMCNFGPFRIGRILSILYFGTA